MASPAFVGPTRAENVSGILDYEDWPGGTVFLGPALPTIGRRSGNEVNEAEV